MANLQGTFQAFVECTATGVTLHSAPPSVRVSVTSNGGEFSGAADLTPSYATLQPNGEGCPPICRQGQASLNLSSTDGGVPDGG